MRNRNIIKTNEQTTTDKLNWICLKNCTHFPPPDEHLLFVSFQWAAFLLTSLLMESEIDACFRSSTETEHMCSLPKWICSFSVFARTGELTSPNDITNQKSKNGSSKKFPVCQCIIIPHLESNFALFSRLVVRSDRYQVVAGARGTEWDAYLRSCRNKCSTLRRKLLSVQCCT